MTQRLSGADGSSLRVRFTPDGLDEQGRQRIVMTITNTSQGPRRFFIQVEPADRNSSDTGDALNHYTESIAAGKKYSLNLTAGGPVTMTSAQLCRSADPSLVARVGWDRGWSKKHQTDEGLDNWQVVGRLSPEAPMVIIEVESTDKDGKSVDSWGWNAGGLPEIGVTWGPEVRPGTKVTLTSVATCSSWNVWDDN